MPALRNPRPMNGWTDSPGCGCSCRWPEPGCSWVTRISGGRVQLRLAGLRRAGYPVLQVFYGKLGYRYSYFDRDQDRGYLKQAKAGIYAGLGIRF